MVNASHKFSNNYSEGYFACSSLVLYGIRAPIDPFRALKPAIPYAIKNLRGEKRPKPIVGCFGCDELVLFGILELAPASLSANESLDIPRPIRVDQAETNILVSVSTSLHFTYMEQRERENGTIRIKPETDYVNFHSWVSVFSFIKH